MRLVCLFVMFALSASISAFAQTYDLLLKGGYFLACISVDRPSQNSHGLAFMLACKRTPPAALGRQSPPDVDAGELVEHRRRGEVHVVSSGGEAVSNVAGVHHASHSDKKKRRIRCIDDLRKHLQFFVAAFGDRASADPAPEASEE